MKILYTLFALAVLASCASPKITSSNSRNSEIKETGVLQLPVVAELKVDQTKSKATVTPSKGTSVEVAKTLAIREILKKTGGDILIHPIVDYEIVKRNITLTVTGYSAKYFNFHQLTKEEVPLYESGVLQKPKSNKALSGITKVNPKTKKIALITTGTIGVGLIGFLAFIFFY